MTRETHQIKKKIIHYLHFANPKGHFSVFTFLVVSPASVLSFLLELSVSWPVALKLLWFSSDFPDFLFAVSFLRSSFQHRKTLEFLRVAVWAGPLLALYVFFSGALIYFYLLKL